MPKVVTESRQNPDRLPLRSLLAWFFVVFAAIGAILPLAVVLYEHRVKWLPIDLILALWPSSIVLLPVPSGPSAILWNALSLALNAFVYGILGLIIGSVIRVISAAPKGPSTEVKM
ncbi:MAG: hypothetical protein ACRD4S_07655 [Candidatus Acidiferrales bacterium]